MGAATGVFDEKYVLEANRLVNDLGLDAISTGNVIAWAMELYERGLITREEIGNIDLRFGNGEALIKLINDIAYQRGFGKVLAQGVADASKILGKGGEYAVHFKGLGLPAWYPNTVLRGLVISYLTADVGGSHLRGWPRLHDAETPLKDTVASMVEDRDHKAVMDSMGLCVFNPYTLDDIEALYRLATGRSVTKNDLVKVSIRIDTIARIWHVLNGYIDPWAEVPRKMIDDVNGPRFRREEIIEGVREFYRIRVGTLKLASKREYLRELKIEWMIDLRDKAEKVLREHKS